MLFVGLSTKNSVTSTIDLVVPFSNNKNDSSADNAQTIAVQSMSSKVQDVISIGSRYCIFFTNMSLLFKLNKKLIIINIEIKCFSDEDTSNDGPKKNINGNSKNSKMSLQSRLQGELILVI